MKKNIIIGMTKSFLDLNGSRSRSLELDYLRIIYANSLYNENIIKSYLLVMTTLIAETINNIWKNKYEAFKYDNKIRVMSYEELLGKEKYLVLKDSISRQVEKNQKGNRKESQAGYAIADESVKLEKILSDFIRNDMGKDNVINSADKNDYPLRINWDYCGHVDRPF